MKKIDWKKASLKDVAMIVGKCLKERGLDAVLVGGACVTIYSSFEYISGDLDFISYADTKDIIRALKDLGFTLESKKYFVHPETPYYLEFLAPPAAVGKEQVEKFSKKRSKLGEVKLLTPTDCVKDRLSAYYHWQNDTESLEQAVMVAKKQKVDLKDIERWSKREKQLDKYHDFLRKLKK